MIERAAVIRSRLREPLRLVIPVLVCCVLLDAIVFRSGWYAKVAEPDSNLGTVTSIRMLQAQQFRAGMHNTLVFGDSRIGEGFSALVANQQQTRLNYINVAIPGSMPRTWWYLLDQFERDGFHPDAVVLGAIYAPRDRTDLADWPLDSSHQWQLLRLSDYPHYLAAIHSPTLRTQTRRQMLLPVLAVQADLQDLLQSPFRRSDKLLHERPGYLASLPLYPGRDEQMPYVDINVDGSIKDWNDASEEKRQAIVAHATELKAPIRPEITAANDAYLQTWYLKIADWCQQHQVQLVVFPPPRGPYHVLQPRHPQPEVIRTALVNHPEVLVLPADSFDALEAPEFFFDTLHLNHTGREALSRNLATTIESTLGKEAR